MALQDAGKLVAAQAALELEFAAIRRLVEVLEGLTPAQRGNVLVYLNQRYAVGFPPPGDEHER
jgi:hypothetical protein